MSRLANVMWAFIAFYADCDARDVKHYCIGINNVFKSD